MDIGKLKILRSEYSHWWLITSHGLSLTSGVVTQGDLQETNDEDCMDAFSFRSECGAVVLRDSSCWLKSVHCRRNLRITQEILDSLIYLISGEMAAGCRASSSGPVYSVSTIFSNSSGTISVSRDQYYHGDMICEWIISGGLGKVCYS